METISLEPVDAVTVTTLVDNVTEPLLVDQGPAKRPPCHGRLPQGSGALYRGRRNR